MPVLAYHLTWTAYGTWLPGDDRGWVENGTAGIQSPDAERREFALRQMQGEPVSLDEVQRDIIRATITRHCEIRGWTLFALNVRSNHVHLVVAASMTPDEVMSQFKAWCSRKLSDAAGLTTPVARHAGRRRWFTEHGSTKWINDEAYLERAIHYVLPEQ